MDRENAVRLAVDSIVRDRSSDITSEALELHLIKKYRDAFEDDVNANLKKSSFYDMEFRHVQYILTPKSQFVFDHRKAALIGPSCLAKFISIVLQYAEQIEDARIPCSKNIVFSFRFNPNERGIFDENYKYAQWMAENKRRRNEQDCQFVVHCDIAAFYDRVNIHRLISTLEDIKVEKDLVRQTNDLLTFWSKKDSFGIPVGNIASRILAEAALIDVDNYLVAEGIVFTRYVDDYRLFAPSLIIAQAWMNKLKTRLLRHGLMLNSGKTKILRAGFRSENVESENDSEIPHAEEVLKTIAMLTGGYTRVVRHFIMPAKEKHEKFRIILLDSELEKLEQHELVDFITIQKVVIAALVQKRFDTLPQIATICSKYLYSLDYFIDMLTKNAQYIPESERNKIASLYEKLIESGDLYTFEWHCAAVARLLSHELFFRKKTLIDIFRKTPKDASSYASMIALEGLKGELNRSDFFTLREAFDRSDEWEKRRLLFLADALPDEERKAWARAVQPLLSGDLLGRKLCEELIRGRTA